MGLFKTLLAGVTGKLGYYQTSITFNLKGDLEDLRKYVKERCEGEGHNGLTATKEKWIVDGLAKKGTNTVDASDETGFRYVRSLKDDMVSVTAKKDELGTLTVAVGLSACVAGQSDVDAFAKNIKDALLEKFPG